MRVRFEPDMVRITGGEWRGRQLRVPRTGVRPTKDMVRQALFSVLGESIQGKRVADLFAGSGAIGLEALSRGAAEAVWVESDRHVHEVLRANVEAIVGPEALVGCIRADVPGWIRSHIGPGGFDLIVADPPYLSAREEPWAVHLLADLHGSFRLKSEGLLVIEQRASQPVIDNPGWNTLKETTYGETRLVYYRRAVTEQEKPSP